MVDDLSDVLLDSVCHYFAKDFSSMSIKEIGLFGGVFVWFWNESNIDFIILVRQCSFLFCFMEQFREGLY
jgi:hypothetical protein